MVTSIDAGIDDARNVIEVRPDGVGKGVALALIAEEEVADKDVV